MALVVCGLAGMTAFGDLAEAEAKRSQVDGIGVIGSVMTVVECDVPAGGALGRESIERADFRDAYRVPLRRPDLGVVDIFFGIFAVRPAWMTLILIARNKVAALAVLQPPTPYQVVTLDQLD